MKVYVYLSFHPFTSYEYLLICILDKNYYTPNTENVQEELFYHSPTLRMPSFVDHLGAASSPALGTPRRVRHVPEQISVERKFVEGCAAIPTLGLLSFVDHLRAVRSSTLGSSRKAEHVPEQTL